MAACSPESADLVVLNARVRTAVDAAPTAEAFAVRDGRFVAIGSTESVRRYVGAETEVVDAGDAAALPGFIDGHVHLESGISLVRGVNLYGIREKAEWLRRIETRAAELPPGTWIVGGRWDHTLLPGGAFPTKADLDRVAPRHPVALSDVDGHSTWVNSLALEIGEVGRDTPNPAGGEILRDATGNPTGILLETAGGLVRRHVPALTADEHRRALRETLMYANRLGITGVHNMAGLGAIPDYLALLDEGELTVRMWFGATGVAERLDRLLAVRDTVRERTSRVRRAQGPMLEVGYVKLVADGVLSSRTAALLEPYADAPESEGLPRYGTEDLSNAVERIHRAGFPVSVHAIGDRAVRMALDAFEGAGSAPKPALPDRIEHIEVLHPADAPRFSALGVLASMNPHHCITGIGVYNTDRVGTVRATWAFPWGGLRDAGASLVFGSDWATAPLDPLQQLYAAVVRERPEGGPEGGWYPQHRVTFEEALRAYTQSPADASGWGSEVGSIEVGKWADFVLLDGALPDALDRDVIDRSVRATYLAGRAVYRGPRDIEN